MNWNTQDPEVAKHCDALVEILESDKDEFDLALELQDYEFTYLARFPDLYSAVCKELKNKNVITTASWNKWMRISQENPTGSR